MIFINDLSGHLSPVRTKNIKCKCSLIFTLPEFTSSGNRHYLNAQGSVYLACPRCKQVYTYTFTSPKNPADNSDAEISLCPDDGILRNITKGCSIHDIAILTYVDFSNDGIVIDDDCVIITHSGGHKYEIELSRIKDEASLVRWLYHLLVKGWFTKKFAKEFIKVVGEVKGFALHGNN